MWTVFLPVSSPHLCIDDMLLALPSGRQERNDILAPISSPHTTFIAMYDKRKHSKNATNMDSGKVINMWTTLDNYWMVTPGIQEQKLPKNLLKTSL